MSSLQEIRARQFADFDRTMREVQARREAKGFINYGAYPLNSFENTISFHDAEAAFIDRAQFGADVTFRSPSRLKERGAAAYIKQDLPELIRHLESSDALEGWVEKVEAKGIYANVKLSDRALFTMLRSVLELGARYGESDALQTESVMLEYSSPNAAKHLHAGHIRSTIIGHVLANIYEAAGATVHRVNYINDWGGFGYLLEGYLRWRDEFKDVSGNELLYQIYLRFREMEKLAEDGSGAEDFAAFKTKAAERFNKLEAGDSEEVALWQEMVGWSLEEFREFYHRLGIFHDYTTFESMYALRGDELVEEALARGVASIHEGAAGIQLGVEERLVIRRSDDSSIYATRDLAALKHRAEMLSATRLVYVVGQEQTDYFSKLFRSAEKLGILGTADAAKHVPFGFYIDLETKKKLSSREGASNVLNLLDAARSHFAGRYHERKFAGQPEELERAVRLLSVGSIAYHDVRKEPRFPVEVAKDPVKAIEGFEASGGAYLMYTAARARSIRLKYGAPLPTLEAAMPKELEPAEVALIKQIAEFPRFIVRAAELNNPAVIAGFVSTLAESYNSYYERYPVLGKDKELAHPHRLIITRAVEITLDNGLKLLHAEGPERI